MRVLTGPEALLEASGSHLGLTEWEAPTADRVAQFLVATGTASPEVDAALVPALMLVSMGPVLTNAGQVCSATARVLMEASVYDDLVDRIVTLAGQCTPGVPKLPHHV